MSLEKCRNTILQLALFVASCTFTVQAQNLTAVPNATYPVTWCLYYSSGPNAGTRAYIANVGIIYQESGWLLGSGGHTHDTGYPNGGRPHLEFAASPAYPNSQTQTWAEAYTNTNGCAAFNMTTPAFAGYYYTYAKIDQTTCNNPYLACINTHNNWDVQVANQPFDNGIWIQQSSQNAGFKTVEFEVDSGHGYPGSNFLYNGFPLNFIGNQYAALGNQPFQLIRGSLPTGGILDGYAVSLPWSTLNSDPHKYGYSMDIYSPTTAKAKQDLVNVVHNNCLNPSTGGVGVYDFYSQHAPTATQMTNTTLYLWHLYCPPSYWPASVFGSN